MFRDDNVPELRRLLNEAQERIRELEQRGDQVVEVDRIVTVQVDGPERVVERVRYVEVEGPERIVYVENPELERTIRILQERLCQFTSASDSQ